MLKVEQYQFMDWEYPIDADAYPLAPHSWTRWYISSDKDMMKGNWDGHVHLYHPRTVKIGSKTKPNPNKWAIIFRGQLDFLGDIFGETFDGTESEVKDEIEKFLVRMDKLIVFM